jgi:hypothetical protein
MPHILVKNFLNNELNISFFSEINAHEEGMTYRVTFSLPISIDYSRMHLQRGDDITGEGDEKLLRQKLAWVLFQVFDKRFAVKICSFYSVRAVLHSSECWHRNFSFTRLMIRNTNWHLWYPSA